MPRKPKQIDHEPLPWERQENETSQAYEAFALYRDLGLKRTHRVVASTLGKSTVIMSKWSSQWNWVERCRAWDNENTRIAREQASKEIADMQRRHINTTLLMQQKAIDALQKYSSDMFTIDSIGRFLIGGLKLERLIRGEPTDRIENTNEVNGKVTVELDPYEGLSTEELRQLVKLAGYKPDTQGQES